MLPPLLWPPPPIQIVNNQLNFVIVNSAMFEHTPLSSCLCKVDG